jgi:hypothetical protein
MTVIWSCKGNRYLGREMDIRIKIERKEACGTTQKKMEDVKREELAVSRKGKIVGRGRIYLRLFVRRSL